MITLSTMRYPGRAEEGGRRERSQFGEKSVLWFPCLSRVSPPWAPNLTSTGLCFRSLWSEEQAHPAWPASSIVKQEEFTKTIMMET